MGNAFHSAWFGLAAGLVSAISVHADGWTLAWSEEFAGPQIDTSVWGYEIGYRRNEEAQYYTQRSENARIDSGHLLIRALKESWQGYAYTSASLRTSGKKSFQYGKFEMRARIDIRSGSWPAWWWLPNSGGWPKGGEIDMMEFYQSKCLFNVMDGNQKWTSKTKPISSLGGARWSEHFHVWTLVWDSLKIQLALDGEKINEYDLANADGTGPNGSNPFRRPGYFILNQALGGTNGGDPSKTVFPVDFQVDWIRMHTWTKTAGYALTVEGGTSSGDYCEGERASLVAKMPPEGMRFDHWEMATGEAQIENMREANTRLVMGHMPVTVRAVYLPVGTHLLEIPVRRKPQSARAGYLGPADKGEGAHVWRRLALFLLGRQ